MSWKEQSPGVFSRPVGENETFIQMCGDPGHALNREHWSLSCQSSFSVTGLLETVDLEAHLRDAWILLRWKHPSIATVIEGKEMVYRIPDATTLQEWTKETFLVAEGQSSDDVVSEARPSPQMTLCFLPKTSEIIFHTAHWRTDGVGIFNILEALYECVLETSPESVAQLAWGKEVIRLVPSVEEAMDVPAEVTPDIEKEAQKAFESFVPAADSVGPALSTRAQAIPGATFYSRLRFVSSTTTSIMQACIKRGYSVTAAVHAAAARANYACAPEADLQKHYTSTARFSLRPYIHAPWSGPAGGAGLFTSGFMVTLPAGTSFAACAAHYQSIYQAGLSKQFRVAHRQYAQKLVDLLANLPPDPPSAHHVDISSLGVIDKLVKPTYGDGKKSVNVYRVSASAEQLGKESIMYFWTFRGQLEFNLARNASFHDRDGSEKFLDHVKKELLGGLGINE